MQLSQGLNGYLVTRAVISSSTWLVMVEMSFSSFRIPRRSRAGILQTHLLKCTRKRGSAYLCSFVVVNLYERLDINVLSSPLKFEIVISGTNCNIDTSKESILSIYLWHPVAIQMFTWNSLYGNNWLITGLCRYKELLVMVDTCQAATLHSQVHIGFHSRSKSTVTKLFSIHKAATAMFAILFVQQLLRRS